MKYILHNFKKLHTNFDDGFSLPPFMSVSLLMIYSIILGAFGYLVGIDLFSYEIYAFDHIFQSLVIQSLILLIFINSNIIILYFFIKFFRTRTVSIITIYSYYALFGTVIFTVAVLLYFTVIGGHYITDIPIGPLRIMFGISIIIILTLTNLYPAILLFLTLKKEPIDVFWPIILCVLIIHAMTFLLFRVWDTVDILLLWL